MPIRIPNLDDRNWRELRDEALRRIAVHNPEWTNLNPTDPGVTIIEVFAFLTETLLYRSNLITERARLRFLQLLGISLHAGSPAQGLVTFSQLQGNAPTIPLNGQVQLQSGAIPFFTTQGLDILPIEAHIYTKRIVKNPPPAIREYYRRLYASYAEAGISTDLSDEPPIYETVPFVPDRSEPLTTTDTVDDAIWVALFALPKDDLEPEEERLDVKRKAIAGKTLNFGFVPIPEALGQQVKPGMATAAGTEPLQFHIPRMLDGGQLPPIESGQRQPQYAALTPTSATNVRQSPGIVQVTLPDDPKQLGLWTNLDPLEAGVGNFPPALSDTELSRRLITWIRISDATRAELRFFWMGINAVPIKQQFQVRNELLPSGTGAPDQVLYTAQTPIIPGSISLSVTLPNGTREQWLPIDDLYQAGAEAPTQSPLTPPGTVRVNDKPSQVFTVDYEAGRLQFGDGHFGTRLPFGATVRANYDVSAGRDGNVGEGKINTGPSLPAGIRVENPVSTWGASDPESVTDGEKQITAQIQNQDRCTDVRSFEMLAYRVAGVGRVNVLPAYTPLLPDNEPGDAPGAVTMMILPKITTTNRIAPMPDQALLDAVCEYLAPRRLVTTELFVRPPTYRDIWVSVGVQVLTGYSIGEVLRNVRHAIEGFLSPLPVSGAVQINPEQVLFAFQQLPHAKQGYPLWKSVVALELQAVASRVEGVQYINQLDLYDDSGSLSNTITMRGLDLPRLKGIAVEIGNAPSADQIPSIGTPQLIPEAPSPFAPVPLDPEDC